MRILVVLSVSALMVLLLAGAPEVMSFGLLGGLGVGGLGWFFALKIARRHHASPQKPAGYGDIWGYWAGGLFLRMLLVMALAGLMYIRFGIQMTPGLLAMAGVYLVLLGWETAWLYRELTRVPAVRSGN
jgi:hypothetical protein